MEIITKSPKETKKIGENLAKKILRSKIAEKSVIIALEGNLGSGKTTFLQGFAKGLGVKERILSPTFVIFKKFKILPYYKNGRSSISVVKYFYHIDCYRIKSFKDLLNLGWKDIIENPKNIVAVEWSEKIKKILPKTAIKIKFKFIDEKTRKFTIDRYYFG